jgi:hypothetical protein
MTVRDIVRKYLKMHGYKGLTNDENVCFCELADLMFCSGDDGCDVPECEPLEDK